jgi:hypothetical protein
VNWNDIEFKWRAGDWATRRSDEQEWFDLFTGEMLEEAESESKSNESTGKKTKLYPLEINPIRGMAEAHRDTVIGILPNHNAVPVRISHPQEQITQVLSQIQKDSNFSSMFMEAILLMQSRGGHAFKVSWEPQRADLQYRARILGINSCDIWPVYEESDPWRLLECYIGHEIDSETALALYGIQTKMDTGLYMEWWNEEEYHIWVDGQTVTVKVNGTPVPLAGKHNIGRVPVVYVPHIRAGQGIWGTSHAKDIAGIVKEINLATADVGDAVFEVTHTNMVGGNLSEGKVIRKALVDQDKNIVGHYWDVGKAPNIAGSHDPFLDYPTHPDVPPISRDYQDQLWALARFQTRTANAALGEIAFSSGRVVGTVMSQLMLPTLSHTQTERTDLATGLQHISDIILRTLNAHRGDLGNMGISVAEFSEEALKEEIKVTWYPAIPVEVVQKNEMLNQSFSMGTISLEALLEDRGVDDIQAEMKKIWDDIEKAAMIQAKADAYVEKVKAQLQAEQQQQLTDQKLQQQQEVHDQGMKFKEEDHKVASEMKKKQAEQQAKQPKPAAAGGFNGR